MWVNANGVEIDEAVIELLQLPSYDVDDEDDEDEEGDDAGDADEGDGENDDDEEDGPAGIVGGYIEGEPIRAVRVYHDPLGGRRVLVISAKGESFDQLQEAIRDSWGQLAYRMESVRGDRARFTIQVSPSHKLNPENFVTLDDRLEAVRINPTAAAPNQGTESGATELALVKMGKLLLDQQMAMLSMNGSMAMQNLQVVDRARVMVEKCQDRLASHLDKRGEQLLEAERLLAHRFASLEDEDEDEARIAGAREEGEKAMKEVADVAKHFLGGIPLVREEERR